MTLDVVYDAQCLFCVRALRLLRRLDVRGVMQLHDSHSPDVASRFPALAGADFENAMFALTSDNRVFRGYFAFKRVIKAVPLAWPLLPLFYVPGADTIGPAIYARIARNRRRFGCDTEVCEPPR